MRICIILSRWSSHACCLALWSELDFPLECPHPTMANPDICYHILRWSVGWDAIYSYLFWQNTHLAFACLCSWAGGSTMVSGNKIHPVQIVSKANIVVIDALGDIFIGLVSPLGWRCRTVPRHLSLAVAWCTWCHSRCRFGNDSTSGKWVHQIIQAPSSLTRPFQTLSRLHVCATLAFAQIIGSICVMVARATAPNRLGPSTVFPDAAQWDFSEGLQGEDNYSNSI